MNRLRTYLLFISTLLAFAAPARADEARARESFRRGIDLYDHKQYREALKEFRDAYQEKPSAGIKQNIALCFKGMNEPIEAAKSFDEALDEGKGTLKPETRDAIEKELVEINRIVATIRIAILDVTSNPPKPLKQGLVSVDGVPLPPGALDRPIRLKPGIHSFNAHVDGFADPPEKRLALVAGSPVDASFQMGGTFGTLTIKPNIEGAIVKVDAEEKSHGEWTGKLTQGTHKIEVSAAGYKTTSVDVEVAAGAMTVYPITLYRPGETPPPYESPDRKPTSQTKNFYAGPYAALDGVTYRLSGILHEPPSGTNRGTGGVMIGAKGGWRMSRFFALEAQIDVGATSTSYKIHPSDTMDTSVSFVQWTLTPVIRFTSPGRIRFTSGIGFGLHGTSVDAKLADTTPGNEIKGSTVTTALLLDLGGQIDAGPVFFEPAFFADIAGVGSVRDPATHERLLQNSPAVRAGFRLGLGIPF